MEDSRAGGIPLWSTNDITQHAILVAILGVKTQSDLAQELVLHLGSKDRLNNTESVLFIDTFKLDHNYLTIAFRTVDKIPPLWSPKRTTWSWTITKYSHLKINLSDGWPIWHSFQVTLQRRHSRFRNYRRFSTVGLVGNSWLPCSAPEWRFKWLVFTQPTFSTTGYTN